MSKAQNPEAPKKATSTTTSTPAPASPAPNPPIPLSAEQRAVRIHELLTELNQLYRDTLAARARPLKVDRPADLVMDDHDLVLIWDLRLFSATEMPIRMQGRTTMSEALHPDLLQQTMRLFQQLFLDSVGTPLNTKMLRYLNRLVLENSAPQPEEIPGLPGGSFPMLPAPDISDVQHHDVEDPILEPEDDEGL